MVSVRVIDLIGNGTDYDLDVLPRIGERVSLRLAVGGEPLRWHHYRVIDVEYRPANSAGSQVAVLVETDDRPEMWPHYR